MNPLSFLLVSVAGWTNRPQQAVIEYLQEEVLQFASFELFDKPMCPLNWQPAAVVRSACP